MPATKRRVIRAFLPSKTNNHPGVILNVAGGIHAITGTSHPSRDDWRQSPNPVVVDKGTRAANDMGLDETTYFFAHHYYIVDSHEFEDWKAGHRFTTPGPVYDQLRTLVTGRFPQRVGLPPAALSFASPERGCDDE